MKRYFITGTDTDCGKTYVTKLLKSHFPKAAAIKPVASGCMEEDGQLVSNDALLLQQHSNFSLDEINPWRFRKPVSPHIASKEEGVILSIQDLANFCLQWEATDIETLLIEGAGGLMVPLNEDETWIDFLRLTKIPVILVVGMRLGCLNHALLTAKVLEINQIECLGWVANCLDEGMLCLEENIDTLKKRLGCPLLKVVDRGADI